MSDEDNTSNLETTSLEQLLASGSPAGLGCPDCGGSLWQMNSGRVKRFQCHVGHAFVGESLLQSQSEEIERHLWTALRLLREQAVLAQQLVNEAQTQQRLAEEIEQFEAQAQQAMNQAEMLHQVLLNHQLKTLSETDIVSPDQANK